MDTRTARDHGDLALRRQASAMRAWMSDAGETEVARGDCGIHKVSAIGGGNPETARRNSLSAKGRLTKAPAEAGCQPRRRRIAARPPPPPGAAPAPPAAESPRPRRRARRRGRPQCGPEAPKQAS